MKLTVVDRIPEAKKEYRKLKHVFDEFMNMNVKIVKVDLKPNEYRSQKCAYNTLHKSAKRHAYPINVVKRGEEIYFVRRDM